MDALFLAAYAGLLLATLIRARSTAWVVVTLAAAGALGGVVMSFVSDRGHLWDRVQLQWALLIVLLVVFVLAWVPALGFASASPGTRLGQGGDLGWRRQALVLGLPVALIVLFVVVMTTLWTEEPAFLRPVSFLIGNGDAEDNAKWLDFTAQFASGQPIEQWVPMGGPLALLLTGLGTVMGVVSHLALGGYNEVAVAANTVVFAEFLMVALVLLALAPLVECRLRGARMAAPLLWASMLALAASTMVLIGFGHLTLQFVILIAVLWSTTFLSGLPMRRARLLTSLAMAAAALVWLPLNAVAVVVLVAWLVLLVVRALRGSLDYVALGLVLIVSVGLWEPVKSSFVYSLDLYASGPPGDMLGGALRGVSAAVRAGLESSPVFAAQGGTEQVGPLLGICAVVVVIAAAVLLAPVAGPLATSLVRRFAPLGLLVASALAIYLLDYWTTGGPAHYGSLKFAYFVTVVALASCLPLALLLLDPDSGGRMQPLQWIGVGAVLVVLTIDSLLPRAVALARPAQWSPPIPFENTSGSYWYPADVNGTGEQPIADNPVACVYLPEGSPFPTAIVPSGLSDAQRVYSCTRQLSGLAGADNDAQPLVDWIRREWLTNTPAWTDVYDGLAAMPPEVLAKPVILLDDGSNVIGLESVGSLLQRFPKPTPAG
jgi:hypothetical protein